MLRSFMQARYSDQMLGHFGLAAQEYTHFTSPIRRYPDLVVHRLLNACLAGEPSQAWCDSMTLRLPQIALHASARERNADVPSGRLNRQEGQSVGQDRDVFEALVLSVVRQGFSNELLDIT
jgi:ribonuclease R